MKLIYRRSDLAQSLSQLLLLLALDRDLHERQHAERQYRQHGDRDHQFD